MIEPIQDMGYSCPSCGREYTPNLLATLRAELAAAVREKNKATLRAETAEADLAAIKDKLAAYHEAANEEVWYWQGKDDHIESIVCRIVIKPEQLRAILGELAAAHARIEALRAHALKYVEPLTDSMVSDTEQAIARVLERHGERHSEVHGVYPTLVISAMNAVKTMRLARDRARKELAAANEANEKLRAEVERLREIEHAAWHALDDGEDMGDEGHRIMREDFDRLDALLPDDHPAAIVRCCWPITQPPSTRRGRRRDGTGDG